MLKDLRANGAFLVLLALLLGCARESPHKPAAAQIAASAVPAVSAAASSSVGPSVDAAPPAAPFALRGIPLSRPPRSGPLRVEGYPAPLATAMSDPASPFGFTRDGKSFAYCVFDACCAADNSRCVQVDATGKTTTLLTPTRYAFLEGKEKAEAQSRTKSQLQAWSRDEKLVELGPVREMWRSPPVPTGSFAFGGEMTLVVREIAETAPKKPDLSDHVPGSVKIGARLDGEREVFVVFPRADYCTKDPATCLEAQLNGLALSPDGSELGFLVYIRAPSHGATFVPTRIPVAVFAARVFNDTGMVHHGKKAYAQAAELFTRAVYTDPAEERYAFNLACALARQGDVRAEHALRLAVQRGGDTVRVRARKDADLAGVRAEPWFEATLSGP